MQATPALEKFLSISLMSRTLCNFVYFSRGRLYLPSFVLASASRQPSNSLYMTDFFSSLSAFVFQTVHT